MLNVGRPRPASSGWSVLELIVALSLGTLAATAAAGLVQVALTTAQITANRLDTQQAARRAVDRLTEELRWADAILIDPACGGLCPDRVRISIPAGNPYRGEAGYSVLFQHNRAQRELERRFGATVNNLASWIERVEFRFFDADGAPAETAAEVVSIRINLLVGPPKGSPMPIESQVALRNR